jgi:hypothetical protein
MTYTAVDGETYRGYRIEVVRSGPRSWGVTIYRRAAGVPGPSDQDDRKYRSSEIATDAGREYVDRMLPQFRWSET